jgi:hypothetical protein
MNRGSVTVLAFTVRNCRKQMDRSGRFDFWGMLLRTQAITPPPAIRSVWRQKTKQLFPAWLVLPAIVAAGTGAALYIANLPSRPVAVSQPNAIGVAAPATPSSP